MVHIANEQTFVNEKIFTARGEQDFATAFKVAGGQFVRVGDVREVGDRGAIDLGCQTVLPGV